ncbi:MAG: hypothetical protein II736_05525, partial [Clostridia bacterium]|nr:hypothetical protein [Clostridia bacterium]
AFLNGHSNKNALEQLEIPSHLSAPNYKADLRQGVAVEYVSCEPTESARELFDEDCDPVEEEQ